MPNGLTDFKASDFLNSEKECAAYLEACRIYNDPMFMAHAREQVEEARKRFSGFKDSLLLGANG